MKIALNYTGQVLPKKIYYVHEKYVDELLSTGAYALVDEKYQEAKEIKNEYRDELIVLKGIGSKTAEKILKKYATKDLLYDAKHEDLYELLDDNDVELLLNEGFVKKKYE